MDKNEESRPLQKRTSMFRESRNSDHCCATSCGKDLLLPRKSLQSVNRGKSTSSDKSAGEGSLMLPREAEKKDNAS